MERFPGTAGPLAGQLLGREPTWAGSGATGTNGLRSLGTPCGLRVMAHILAGDGDTGCRTNREQAFLGLRPSLPAAPP